MEKLKKFVRATQYFTELHKTDRKRLHSVTLNELCDDPQFIDIGKRTIHNALKDFKIKHDRQYRDWLSKLRSKKDIVEDYLTKLVEELPSDDFKKLRACDLLLVPELVGIGKTTLYVSLIAFRDGNRRKINVKKRRKMKLKKSDLIERLVEEMSFLTDETSYNIKTEIARKTVNLFFNSIKESIKAGDRVEIRGFGSFHNKHYEGYAGRNPKTGEKVEAAPKNLPVFRAGKELKEIVNKKFGSVASPKI